MKIMTCLIDSSAWLAIANRDDPNHHRARDYFKELLEKNAKIVTNNAIIDETLQKIKAQLGNDLAKKFMNIIDESVITVNLRVDWISRRTRKSAINQYLRSSDNSLELKYFFIHETLKRKKVDIIFGFDEKLNGFGLPLMPLKGGRL